MKKGFWFLSVTIFSAMANTATPISNFNGSTQQYGLMHEPIPSTFYSTTIASAAAVYGNNGNFRAAFQLDATVTDVTATIINEEDFETAVLITGITQATDIAQNFLLQIPAHDILEIDITSLKQYTTCYMTSLTETRIYFNKQINQDGTKTNELTILNPSDDVEPESADSCNCIERWRRLLVTNANGPAQGGSAVGYFIFKTLLNPLHKKVLTLRVDYPSIGITYHHPTLDKLCNTANCGIDEYTTTSISGRSIFWEGVKNVVSFRSTLGNGTCTAPSELCTVQHNGTTQRALWDVTPQ